MFVTRNMLCCLSSPQPTSDVASFPDVQNFVSSATRLTKLGPFFCFDLLTDLTYVSVKAGRSEERTRLI